jgi:maltose alpha-D-glucosyltransferase/alpha-amylase
MSPTTVTLKDDPLWFKTAVIYQAHVRAFYDSNRDGVGDFSGLTAKLDYIQDLGCTAIWILPFYPSPLRDGGYDISDYTGVHPAYGSLRDFRNFVRAAHARGLRVITELVLNHTSDQHPWFQRARHAKPGSKWRDWYVWSDDPTKYAGTRIIFKDFEASNWTWDPEAGAYYWHRFYSHQPDLNWDNPAVERELTKVMAFWLETGVDGLRLDAVPYLYEREGTTCENLPETHDALKRLRSYVDKEFPNRMLLAEANQWPEDSVAYFGDADECHMAFHFPLMPRLYLSMNTEDRFPLIDIMHQTPEIPDTCQWAIFLRNHDELTLEMVTDEERDYMYRSYAANPQARINLGIRRRLAPLLNNDRRKIELLNGLLFSFNGTPIVYYGDEIGMGDNIYLGDRDGCRTPMQWSADRNAGFSGCDPQRLYLPVNIDPEYRYEAVNVEAQQRNMNSLYWWMKRLIALRRRFSVLADGELRFLHPENTKILAFIREYPSESDGAAMLIVANLSRSVQYAELDLHAYEGRIPREVFGRTRFPRIGELPYLLTLGPYQFYWFELTAARPHAYEIESEGPQVPVIEAPRGFAALVDGAHHPPLERLLPGALANRRWFAGKARTIDSVVIEDSLVPSDNSPNERLLLVRVEYEEGPSDAYFLPVAYLEGAEAFRLLEHEAWAVLARVVRAGEEVGVVADAMALPGFRDRLLATVAERRVWRGRRGSLRGVRTRQWQQIEDLLRTEHASAIMRVEQSNTSIHFVRENEEDDGGELVLKLLRRAERGVNPDLEIGRYLTEQDPFTAFPRVTGAIEYADDTDGVLTAAVVQEFVVNHGDAWKVTQQRLGDYLERAVLDEESQLSWDHPDHVPLEDGAEPPSEDIHERIGEHLHMMGLLGQRTAELHMALGRPSSDEVFAPAHLTAHDRRSLYQSMRALCGRTFQLLSRRLDDIPEKQRPAAEEVLNRQQAILAHYKQLVDAQLGGARIRCHGDFHLGQVLFTGRDWVIIDFEGEPARSIGERRIKRSPMRDVAGMIRSLHYATYRALAHEEASGVVQEGTDAYERMRRALSYWRYWVGRAYLTTYLEHISPSGLLPADSAQRQLLLDAFSLDKAIYELGYELGNRPAMVGIPLEGILELAPEEAR